LQQIQEKLQGRLNVSSSIWYISSSDAQTLWELCEYEYAVYGITDKFCSFFDEMDGELFELSADISNYYLKGYGYKINWKISSILLQNIVAAFDNAIETNENYAYLRFAHAETVLPFLCLLGLYNDSHPPSTDPNSPTTKNRMWKTSLLSPFAANIFFVLYNCSGEYYITIIHNELEIPLPSCNNRTLCLYRDFKFIYREALKVNWNKLCKIPTCTSNIFEMLLTPLIVGAFLAGLLLASFTAFLYIKLSSDKNDYEPVN